MLDSELFDYQRTLNKRGYDLGLHFVDDKPLFSIAKDNVVFETNNIDDVRGFIGGLYE